MLTFRTTQVPTQGKDTTRQDTSVPYVSPPRIPSPLHRPTFSVLPALIISLSSGAGVLMHSIIPYS